MPSRKRNKGKERKAKKAALEAEKVESERSALRRVWQGWARGLDNCGGVISQCNHGCDLVIPDDKNHPVTNFMDAMFTYEANNGGDNNMNVGFYLRDTFTTHKEVWDNESYRKMVISIFIAIGTNLLLSNDSITTTGLAFAIVAFENYEGEDIMSTLNSRGFLTTMRDICIGETSSSRDILKLFRKRTTCKCLKKMHLEARKTQPKLGVCYHCEEVKERALLMVCSRCRVNHYCSRECQISNWPEHKRECDITGDFWHDSCS